MANVLATIIVSRKSKIEQFPGPLVIEPDSEVTIGRSTSCSLSFPDFKHISHVHCHIRNKDGQVQLKSVSSNKTLLDSKPVNKDEWTKLRDGNTITLCADPKVRLDVRLGSGVRDSPVKKRKHTAKRSTAIAEITSLGNADLEYLVKPSSKHSRDVSVTIGRAKDCDVSIDDKKVSSTHVKLVFTRVEGESIHWDLQVEAVATRNKTYVGNELVEESKTIKSFSDPIDVCLVFPRGEKPVEVLTVSPLFVEAEPSSQEEKAPLTAAEMIQQELEKAEKRQKKELRELEKQSKVWKVEYEKEIQKFQDVEHSLIRDTEVIEGHIRAKHGEISVLSAAVSQLESEMTDKQNSFKEQLSSAKSEHESRIVQYTAALSETVARLQKLMDEKLKIQMNMSLEVQ